MESFSWNQVLLAAFGGGLTVKLLDIGYQEFRSRFGRKQTARKLVDDHLDPVLKTADEIVGKLRSLAEEDFRSLRDISADASDRKMLVLLYLFAHFWARIELLRRDSIAVNLQEHPKGKRLKEFLDCIESRRVRLVDRGVQRAIGETLVDRSSTPGRTILFIDFANLVQDAKIREWYEPLICVILRLNHTRDRQRMLQYGTILHALIDTLDPEHHVTGERPSWSNKLTRRSVSALRYRVFGRYLRFVRANRKYLSK